MQLRIDWENPYLTEEQTAAVAPGDLDDFYAAACPTDQLNLFFVLLNTCTRAQERGESAEEARLCFLMAYYLFVPLTPPGSWPLAQHYISRAVALDPCPQYRELQDLIFAGN